MAERDSQDIPDRPFEDRHTLAMDKSEEEEMNELNERLDRTETYGQGERDPNGVGQHEHGAKTDDGKPDCSLLLMFGKALKAVAGVGTHGARKYTRGGWQGVDDGINRYTAALLRHLCAEHYEEFDQELPVRHAAQVAWNALARLELMLRDKDAFTHEDAMMKAINDGVFSR